MRLLNLLLSLAACVSAASVEVVGPQNLIEPFGVAFGMDGSWYICEYKGQKITKVNADKTVQALGGDLKDPHGLVITRDAAMYIADTLNHRIQKVDLKTGKVTTIAGTGQPGYSGDGGPALQAQFNGTFALDADERGERLYVADLNNRRVRMIDLRSGTITTVAGNGTSDVPDDGATGSGSPLVDPRAVAVDRRGNVYILERRGNALRVLDPQGRIRTLIAPGTFKPDLNGPKHLAIDKDSGVLIADAENHLIRKYNPQKRTLITVAGTGKQGSQIDPVDPLKTEFARPHGISVHRSGDLYISDSYNGRIIRVRR